MRVYVELRTGFGPSTNAHEGGHRWGAYLTTANLTYTPDPGGLNTAADMTQAALTDLDDDITIGGLSKEGKGVVPVRCQN